MIALVLAQIRVQWARFVAVTIGVALASGFVAASFIVDSSLRAGIEGSIGESYSRADLVLVPTDGATAGGESVVAIRRALEAVPGVRAIAVDAEAEATGREARDFESSFIVSPVPSDARMDTFSLTKGHRPTAVREVAVDSVTADQLGLALGDTLNLSVSRIPLVESPGAMPVYRGAAEATKPFRVVGLTEVGRDPRTSGQSRALVTTSSYQEFFAQLGQVRSIQVALDSHADPESTLAGLRAAVATNADPHEFEVVTAREAVDRVVRGFSDGNDVVTWILLVFAGISVTVAVLVVSNTFSVIVAGRRRELALLRCLGASRAQVYRSVLIEGLLVGLAGSLVGTVGAVGLSHGLAEIARRLWPDQFAFLEVSTPVHALVLGTLVGVGMTVAATVVPGRSAVSVTPLESLKPIAESLTGTRRNRIRWGSGWACIGFGAIAIVAAEVFVTEASSWIVVGAIGGTLVVVGLVLCSALIIPAIVGAVGDLLVTPWGIPGRLATLNTMRNRRRTASTASALIIGVTLVGTILVGGSSTKATTTHGLEERFPVDVAVPLDESVPEASIDALREIPGVAAVVVGHRASVVDAVDGIVPELYVLDPDSAEAVLQESAPEPVAGRIIVPVDFAGETVEVKGLNSRFVPVVRSGRSSRVYFTTPDIGNELGVAGNATVVLLRLEAGSDSNLISVLRESIAGVLEVAPTTVSGSAIERSMYAEIIDTLLAISVGLLLVAVLIALIGVSNTISLSVIERRRENALLRALGLSLGQLRLLLALEAALISTVAALIGLALGTVFGIAGTRLITVDYSSLLVIRWPVGAGLGILAVAIMAGLVSSLAPARRAAHLTPVEGLGREV